MTRASHLSLPFLFLLLLLLGGSYLLLAQAFVTENGPGELSEDIPGKEPTAGQTPGGEDVSPTGSKRGPSSLGIVRSPSDPTRMIALPDGTYAPPLNGVFKPAPFRWPRNIPYAPIVGKETDDFGVEWYVHADGSKSTTRMVWHSQEGRFDAMTQIANPTGALPILESERGR